MKLSYNWLKEYINIDPSPQKMAEVLTDTGLEVEGLEQVSSVRGGLEGLVIGEVLEKEKHPDADRLSVTKVNIGNGEPLPIVCGAPNVAKGQKVVVAPPGTTIYPINGEPFKIKETKIRGQLSQGMICAEDEIGLGEGHDGIIVLEGEVQVGRLAAEYYGVESDWMLEIGLTPNRTDGMGHIGAARDLVAAWNIHEGAAKVVLPESGFSIDNNNDPVEVVVEDNEACPRYCGVSMSGVTIGPSPDWLQNRLRTIGIGPINNVVDVTNYVLHETGHPLHAFDRDKITGGRVIVKKLAEGTTFKTLDETERKLSAEDLMICNTEGGMCIAGVFGGIESGVSNATTNIFLEGAYFDPIHVRKTAKRHALNTDASFRYERGVDPNNTLVALKRAAAMIRALAGGQISSEVSDTHPEPFPGFNVELSYQRCDTLIGKSLERETIKQILGLLDIGILNESAEGLSLEVPAYRADVQREADVIEEILRIYGYNNIELPGTMSMALIQRDELDKEKINNRIADLLVANGFNEIMNNSLTASQYYDKINSSIGRERKVQILNPLSSELDVLRQTMLYSGMEVVERNQNHRNPDLRLFEFGKVYEKTDTYNEGSRLSLYLTGRKEEENWNATNEATDFYVLKGAVEAVLTTLGIFKNYKTLASKSDLLADGITYGIAKKDVVTLGWVRSDIRQYFDVKAEVYYAEFDLEAMYEALSMNKVKHHDIPKFPSVRRDFSLLLDSQVQFGALQAAALKCDNRLLRHVGLFDVYEGKNLPEGKKSYALSYEFRDDEATLTDEVVDGVMDKIKNTYEKEFGAELR